MEKNIIKQLHLTYKIAIFLKFLDGLFETLLGFFLFFININFLKSTFEFFYRKELVEDPKDLLGNLILHSLNKFDYSSKDLISFYLFIHGIIKLFIVYGLYSEKLWIFPVSIFLLIIFIISQTYYLFISFSFLLLLITIFDIFIIFLVYFEYKNKRSAIL